MIRRILLDSCHHCRRIAGRRTCDRACLQGFVDSYLRRDGEARSVQAAGGGRGEIHRKRQGFEARRWLLEDRRGEHLSALCAGSEVWRRGGCRPWCRRTANPRMFFVRLKVKLEEDHRSGDAGLPQGPGRIFRAGEDENRAGAFSEAVPESARSTREQLAEMPTHISRRCRREGSKD